MTADPGRRTILIVDDEAPLLRLISRVLERDGFTTLTAADGHQARACIDEHARELDAAILDVFIPPNGVEEVIDHIDVLRPGLPLILSSGDVPTPKLGERIEALGAVFLRKPFRPRALVDLVTRSAKCLDAPAHGGVG